MISYFLIHHLLLQLLPNILVLLGIQTRMSINKWMIKLVHNPNASSAFIVVTTLYLSCLPFFFLPALRVVCLKESWTSFFWAGGNLSTVGNELMLPLFVSVESESMAANAWTSKVSTRRRTFASSMFSTLLWICSRRFCISCRVSESTIFFSSEVPVVIHARLCLLYFTWETSSWYNVHLPDSLCRFGNGV